MSVPNVIFFGFNSATINAAQHSVVENIAGALRANPNARVQITGHAYRGENENYRYLSVMRAEVKRDALIAQGIANNRIIVVGGGEPQFFGGPNQDSWNRVAISIIQ